MLTGGQPQLTVDSPAAAESALCQRLEPVATEVVDLREASGRVLAKPILADRPSPALDVSVMDGFAVRLADLGGGRIKVLGDAMIGQAPMEINGVGCLRIVTGAPLPHGADCVVRREDVSEIDGAIEIKPSIAPYLKPGTHVRRRGENAQTGATIVEIGTLVTPAVAGALATSGVVNVPVHRCLRIGILTTGDEVVAPTELPQAWQLRDSNGTALAALFSRRPIIAEVRQAHARDDATQIRARAAELLDACDALFLTGGVSMGHRDFVPSVLGELGVRTVFHKVPQRPGRPLLGGVSERGQPVLGLPGNPVSVLVTARRIGLPVIEHLSGARQQPRPRVRVSNPDDKTLELWWHRLARLTPNGDAELVDNRGSGDVVGAARSEGFVEVPPGEKGSGPWAWFGWE